MECPVLKINLYKKSDSETGGFSITPITLTPITSADVVVGIDYNITGAETAIGDATNHTRRKCRVTYGGMNVLIINVSGYMDLNSTGSFESGKQQITPGRIRQMWVTPRTYHFYDNKLGSALIYDSNSSVKNPYSGTSGEIPVSIESITFNPTSDSTNEVPFELVLIEDKP